MLEAKPNSLIGQIMKAKYFPNTNILDATLDATVSTLIDDDTRWWKSHLLETLFHIEDIQMIKTMPLSCTNQEDIQIWSGTKNGIFFVRSAYHLQQELLLSQATGSSHRNDRSAVWKELWALQVPNAKKKFMWRACHDILPTRANLYKRNIVNDPKCPICGREVETGFHILWQCPSAMDVWSMGNKKLQKRNFIGPYFVQVVEGVLAQCSPDEVQMFVGLARRIWLRRNEIVHGGFLTHLSVLLQLTTNAIAKFNKATVTNGTPTVVLAEQPARWMAP
ncbi:uncharacterized protein LOC132182133 [Corylus avellana]|uniref:uncharacterized protein LOC132182133 n=1 Tax=Corylus avellana TaxID=13451 RepID=UPI00286D0FCA|nr:uncharacterized protein LOC132182133 [Corylus avellana]